MRDVQKRLQPSSIKDYSFSDDWPSIPGGTKDVRLPQIGGNLDEELLTALFKLTGEI